MSEYMYLTYSEDILQEAQKVMDSTSRDFYKCDPQEHIDGVTFTQLTNFLQV